MLHKTRQSNYRLSDCGQAVGLRSKSNGCVFEWHSNNGREGGIQKLTEEAKCNKHIGSWDPNKLDFCQQSDLRRDLSSELVAIYYVSSVHSKMIYHQPRRRKSKDRGHHDAITITSQSEIHLDSCCASLRHLAMKTMVMVMIEIFRHDAITYCCGESVVWIVLDVWCGMANIRWCVPLISDKILVIMPTVGECERTIVIRYYVDWCSCWRSWYFWWTFWCSRRASKVNDGA